eukprot:Gb_24052 [translate_table: standard]
MKMTWDCIISLKRSQTSGIFIEVTFSRDWNQFTWFLSKSYW